MSLLRVGIGQIGARLADFAGNKTKIVETVNNARKLGVDLLVFPEMSVSGYPVEDLAQRGSFLKALFDTQEAIAHETAKTGIIVIIGGIEPGDALYNGAAVMHGGKILGWARKRYLFCCGRFDEGKHFSAGDQTTVLETEKFRAAVTLGKDFGYPVFPGEVEILINLWNEPYRWGKRPLKGRMLTERAREDAVAIVMASPAGGQDDLIFEGSSKIINGFGDVLARGKAFAEDLVAADLDLRELKAIRARALPLTTAEANHLHRANIIRVDRPWPSEKRPAKIKPRIEPLLEGPEEVFSALTLAVRDFVTKNGCAGAVLGLSGGIDSALTAAIACRALGPKNVLCVSMPGPFTTKETRADAKKFAANLKCGFLEIPIVTANQAMLKSLAPAFKGTKPDNTEENLQSRLRGVILMALANKRKALLLATGNKSEGATGYCTLYGDTNGAFAPIADLYKTQVYEISRWYNRHAGKAGIPQSILDRAPTAELRPNQKDQDTLPPYADLDRILEGLLEKGLAVSELVEAGESEPLVYSALGMLMQSEFKRRQVPIGPTVSVRPLSELRIPITKDSHWWEERKRACGGGKKRGKK